MPVFCPHFFKLFYSFVKTHNFYQFFYYTFSKFSKKSKFLCVGHMACNYLLTIDNAYMASSENYNVYPSI